jgi:hypothetical protein
MSGVVFSSVCVFVFLVAWSLGSWAAYQRGHVAGLRAAERDYLRGWREGWKAALAVARIRGEGEP